MTKHSTNPYSIISLMPEFIFLAFIMLVIPLYDIEIEYDVSNVLIFGTFSIIIVLVFLYIWNIERRETILYLLYYLSSIAAISSTSLLSLAMLFEVMTLSVLIIIASGSNGTNRRVFMHYSLIHFLAGVMLLIGASGQFFGSVNGEGNYKIFFLIGLLINCACFPLSSWVTDTYSTVLNNDTIILSVFTTKVSVYLLMLFFHGEKILLFLGIATSIYGIIFSMLENNIKRLLCYNLVGQMGLIITTIGFSYEYNDDGVSDIIILQIILSIIYQSLLFMVATSVINSTQRFNLSEIGGLLKKMPIEAICSIVAISNMGALPGTAGFVVKFKIIHMINNMNLTEVLIGKLFLLCSMLLFMSVGIKFFSYIFVSKSTESPVVKKVCVGSKLSISILALICILLGIVFSFLLAREGIEKWDSIVLQLKLIFGSIIFFVCFPSLFKGRVNFIMDIDWVYRVLFMHVVLLVNKFLLCIYNILVTMLSHVLSKGVLLCSKSNREILSISSVNPLGFTIMLGMLFIIIMVVVYLCLNL